MNVVLKEHTNKSTYQNAVIQEIETHSAWHGHISGLVAETTQREKYSLSVSATEWRKRGGLLCHLCTPRFQHKTSTFCYNIY